MKDRSIKWLDGVKLIGVIDPANDGCFILLRGERIYCPEIKDSICSCPFGALPGLPPSGMWLTEEQALPLLLTGDAK